MPEYDSTISYRPIPKFPGYCAGSDGSIWSCCKHGPGKKLGPTWHQLKQATGKGKYKTVHLGKRNGRYVHRLVLEAFVGRCPRGMECCHKDGNRTNNQIANLRWDTRSANHIDMHEHATSIVGEKNPTAKLNEESVRMILSAIAAGRGPCQLAREFNVSYTAIRKIVLRKTWKHIVIGGV